MKSGRRTAAAIAVVGVLLNLAASRVLDDADVGPRPKQVITAIMFAEVVALLVMTGAAPYVAVAGAAVVGAVVFLLVGTLARVAIALVAVVALTLRLTRKRPARGSGSASRIIPRPIEATFDAVMVIPADSPGARIVNVRELSDGRTAWTLLRDSFAEDNITTEIDRPSRVVVDTSLRVEVGGTDVDIGSIHTILTLTTVRSGTRLRVDQTFRLRVGGLRSTLKLKTSLGRQQRRYLREIEALATAEPATAGERVADPETGPYLQPD